MMNDGAASTRRAQQPCQQTQGGEWGGRPRGRCPSLHGACPSLINWEISVTLTVNIVLWRLAWTAKKKKKKKKWVEGGGGGALLGLFQNRRRTFGRALISAVFLGEVWTADLVQPGWSERETSGLPAPSWRSRDSAARRRGRGGKGGQRWKAFCWHLMMHGRVWNCFW